MVVLKKFKIIFFFTVLFLTNISQSNQILDYETELFIGKLIEEVKKVNKFNKNIQIFIIKDNNPNAFVIPNNKLILSSGLIEQSPDYVALLAVLAHEVGHLEYFHLEKRKDSLEQLSKINLISNLALITGSVLSNEPQILGGTIASQTNINNFYMSFNREQEREADLYSINTLNKLNLSSSSVKKLLKILENNALNKGYNEDYQKFSTHPIFKERYEIIDDNKKDKLFNFNKELQNKFNFIKAKFMAFNDNLNSEVLNNDHKIYYDSISYSKSGNFKTSLQKVNFLIKKYPENINFLETKGDILRSNGFISESSKFYQIVLSKYPENHYVRYKIFLDSNIKNLNNENKNMFFYNNINLLIKFPKNKYIINKFLEITNDLDKMYWTNFLNLIIDHDSTNENFIKKLNNLSKKTDDKKLKKFIVDYKKI